MFKISLIVQLVTLLLLQGIGVYASPFSQFTTSTTSNCSTNEVNSCVDLVFLINLDSSLNVDLPQLLDLASKLPATGYNCNHRYGITVYGSTTPTTIAYISGTSYFGDVTQFNSVLSSYLSPGTASTGATTFESINSIVENYAFRDGVDREIVLIASELLSETTSSVINSYENILLTLLQNEITLSVITRGIEYFTSASRVTRLIGMNFHSNVGLGQFSYTTTCTSDPYQTTTTHYEIQTGYEMNYKSYVELAWNTNGSSYDLSYFDDSSTYCSSHASQVFYDGTIQVVCVPKGDSYSYSLESSNTYYTMWSDIQSEDVSNCVDMVILLDRTASMNSYFDSIQNLSSQLPEAGNNCDNRYGLTLFHDVVEIVNLTSSFWGTPTQLSNAFGFARVGFDEDGYLGISRIIESYTFRSYVKKHIVLFTDEPRRIVDSSLTKSSTKSLLESNEITFSIVSETEDFYYDLSSTQIEYLDAVVQYSNDMIGFIGSSSLPINVDAYNPAYLTIHDNAQHEDYVELAWSTDGVAYNIDFYRSSFYYDRNSAIFNTLMFSYESMPREYYLTSISSSIVGVRNNAIHYSFACKTNSVDNTSISLILNGVWHTNNDSSEISITAEVWTTTPGEYNFICTANNSIMGSSWLGSFTIPDLSDSPFSIFAPNYVPENSGITCDSYDLTSCIDLVFIIDFDIISTYSSLSRISAFIGSLGQSNCVNRYGLTVFGSSNGVSIINITSSSQFGSASELQNALNTNLYSGLVLASSDAYAAIDVAIKNYQFRSDVQKKFVLITDRSQASDSNYIYENMLHYILLNDVILSVFTSADIYTTSLQDRLIGMSGSNRIGYGNYSYCSLSPDSISTVFNAQYTINNVNKHYEYVELAWTTGGASYDLSYFDSVQFCSGIIVEVFSFATLAETPCEFNGEIYSYSSKAEFSYYTEWNDIISRQNSSCVDMVFVVDRTGSMSSYYSAINNLANNLPTSGDSCQNQFGLVIFHDSVTMINVGTGQWGTPSELYAALLTFSTSGLDEDGLQAIDYVIDQYTFRNNVVKHIVLFGDEARSIIDSSITNETVFQKLNSSGIILSVVTDADSFYSLEPDLLLAGVLLSDTLIGFGSDDDDDQIDSYSPSTYNILDDDVHTNYVQLAWKTGGVAYDLSFFGTLNYIETSTAFNRLMFSYGANSNFSLPQEFNPVEIINIDVYTNTTTDNIEYKFICEANPSPDLSMRLLIDGELYINSASSISVIIPLSHLAVGKYYFVCVANNSQGIDSKIAEYNIVDQPIYPFLQFGPDFNPNSQDSCNTFVASECADLVFILSMTQLMSIEIDYIMNLSSSLSASTNNCNNRYGLTLYGLSTGSIVVNVSLNSIFGTAQELRTAIDQNEFIESIVGAGIQDGYMGIHDVIEQYKFRDGVMRRILLFTNEARQTTTSSSQYNYEDTLLLLLKNNISLSVVSNGAEYTTELSQERLIGIIYNNRIGFGLYNETDCTNPLELVQDAQYSVTDRDVYVSYNELGWSTGGAVLDINYFQSSTYCPELLLEAVTLAVFLDATCEGLTYTYENRTDDGSYIIWDDINPQSFSNCVDMIFIVDRSGSMDNYYPSIINLASNLPTNGESCVNRYGLTLFEGYSTVQYIGGGNTNLFGTPTELAAAFSFVQSGRDEDGLLAINDVIDNYSFRSDVQKHVVLFTDEPRTAVSPSVTKLSVLDRLNERGIILSVVTEAHEIYHSAGGSISYTYAAIKISNTFIGFADGNYYTDIIDAISPVFLNTLDSNAEENYVDLAWETGGIAFDLHFFDNSLYDTRSSAVFNKLMFSWGGRANSSSSTTYAPVLVSAINSTLISSHTGDLIFSFICISTSTSDSNVSLLVDGDWYTNLNSGNIEQSVVFEYPFPHPGSYDFLCVANNSIGGDQTLGVYTVPDALRIYPQYSQFTYIPDSHIECGTTSLQESQCVDLVVVIDINAYTDATIDRIISFTASLPANSTTCLNRYGLTLYGTSTLSQIISLTNSPTQSYFSTPSDLSSAIQTQRNIGTSLGSGSRDGYEAIDKIVKLYSFRSDVQKKIIFFSNEVREVAPTFSNLTFQSTIQTLLANRITLSTVSNADNFYYFYNNTDNRLIGMYYNTRTGIGNFSSSCDPTLDNIVSIPSVEYSITREGEHKDYVELAWRTDGTAFDLSYFEQSSGYCSELVDAIIQYAVVQNFPCTLNIVDYAFTSRSQFPDYFIWENILPQVTPICLDMVFLFDVSVLSSNYFTKLFNLINYLAVTPTLCDHVYTAYSYSDGYDAIEFIVNNHPFETDYIKSIIVITEFGRNSIYPQFTKSSTLDSLLSNGIILSVISSAGDFYYGTSPPVNILAAVRVSDTLIGFRSSGINNTILDAISTVNYTITDSNIDNDYVDIAWQTGGVSFDIDLITEDISPFATLMFIWGNPAPIEILSMSVTSQGTPNDPSPYQFTCTINDVPHATLTLIIDGVSYVSTDTTTITRVLSLSNLIPDIYEFLCIASNSNGGDTQRSQFTIKGPIPSPFTQFAFKSESGESCHDFEPLNCVDLIFLLDISGPINKYLNRIAELAGNLPEYSPACENRYGLLLFGIMNPTAMNLSANSLYGTPSQLKSAILGSLNIADTLSVSEDGYFSIHLAVGSYPFRNGVERRLALFANESVQPYSTYEHTISLLFQNEIKLTAFTYFGDIFYYTASTELIGMNFFSNIGFGNLSSTDTDINIVPNPYLKLDSGSSDESFVKLAFNTDGSIFNMKYMSNDTTPYSPELIAELFEFAVIHDVPCNLDDVYFNFENRTLTYSSPLYSKWMHITPQVQSNCVDMVFLVDRTITFRQFMPGVMSIANNLPENGNGCVNRYGLVTFETTAIIINVGVSTKFGTANQLYNQLISFSYSGATEDGYVGIDAIVNEFEFRDSDTIQKHIILFGDEPRRIVNSSLTDTSILQALGDNNIILTVATTADNFYQLDYTTRLHVAALISNSYIGFASNGTNQEYVDVYSPIDLYTYSSNQHDSYVALAWQSGGLAFDLDYFRDSLINMRTVVTLFNTLMFSWGSPVDLQIIPSSYEANNQLTIECSTNDVSNPSISLIVGDQLYSNTNSNSLQTTFSSWNYSTYSYICIAYNSVGGASDIATLDIEIPNGLPVNYSLTVQSSESILVEWERSVGSNIVLISYRVVYQGILFDTMQYTATTTDTDVILENLSPFTNYSVYIIANTPSNSSQTDVKIATTFQYPPTESPQNITAIPVNSTTILINMYPPSVNHQNGPIRNYSISYQQGEQEVTTFIILNTMGTYPLEISSQIYVSSLLPFTNYTFTIFATNDAGSSPNVSVIEGTNPAAPSQPPQNITAYSNSATSITVAYYPPPYFYQNGIITRYLITIQGTPFDSELKEISVPVNLPVYPLSEEGRYIFTQLHAYNTYSIRVTAVNSVGAGPTSSPITATTLQSAPTESPQNVTAIPISSTSILLTCLPPSPTLQNGPIRNFTILYYSEWNSDIIETASILIDSSESYPFMLLSPIVISSLQPYTKYTFSIIAINDAGESPNVTVTTRTRIAAPTESPQNITATTINSTTILINMYPPSVNHQNGLIRNYSIFYQQGEQEITLFIILNTMGTYPLEISSQIYVSSLLPFTNYTFTIIATNDAGSSPNVYIMERTNPADSVPIITSPLSDKVLNPELSLTYIEQFICEATGYPPPTILWYSNNEPVTTGATLTLTTSNVTDGKEYVCQAENDLGSDSRIIIIAIDPTDIAINNVLDDIAIVLDNPSEFDPNQVGPITILISNILPNITDIDISEIDGVKDTLANTADILDDLFDVITDNDTAISLDDAGDIVNTAGDIINKDSELEDISINTDLSTQQINMGGIAIASDALVIALLTIEKVCHNLGLNYFKDALIQDTFVVNRTHVNIYGANIPISNQLTDETFPLNENSENNIIIPENVIRDLAGDQLSMKVVMAIVGKYGTKDSNIHETGLEQDSKIVTIVIPGRNESVSLVENATIIFNSALSNYSTDRIGTYLIGNLWSINGIQTIDTAISTTSLVVDHFTSFVVFATHSISPSSSLLQYYLDISSYILSAISVLCLICSLFLFIFAGKKGFFKIEINILYFNLCVALLFSTILFVLYGLKPDVIGISDLLCKIMAAIIHYSCILVFAWAFAFAIYISYKIKFGIRKNRKIYPYIIIFAWILPIVFPVVTLAIKLDVYVDVTNHCFPSLTDYVLIGLLAPVLFIAAITIVMVVILSIAFVVVRKKIENELIRNEIKHILLSTTLMTCILTIPWFTLVIFIFTESPVIEWTFVLLNDTVGIFFFIFIALRIKEVRLLLLCKSLPNANETVNRDGTRPDTFNNPIYDGNIQNLPDTMDEIYAEVAEKSGYEVMEKGAYEKEGEKSKEAARHFNPYQVDPSASPYSNQMYESDLPPIYDCIAGCQTGNQGISNPMYDTNLTTISNTIHETSTGGINNPFYESTAVEGHIECDYEELSYPNPFVSGEVPSPIHPTGTKLDKENPSDV